MNALITKGNRMTVQPTSLAQSLGLFVLLTGCVAGHADPLALELSSEQHDALREIGVIPGDLVDGVVPLHAPSGARSGEASLVEPGVSEVILDGHRARVETAEDRSDFWCDGAHFVMVADADGDFRPREGTNIEDIDAACRDAVSVAQILAAGTTRTFELPPSSDEVGATTAALGECNTRSTWALGGCSRCYAALGSAWWTESPSTSVSSSCSEGATYSTCSRTICSDGPFWQIGLEN
jgi:hypothetical protein